MTRRIVVTATLVAGGALAWTYSGLGRTDVKAAAPVPAVCRAALAPAPPQGTLAGEITRAQEDARQGLDAKRALERLGYLYVSRARSGNDPGDYTLAEAAAACLDAKFPGETTSLLLRGHVLHQLHRFSEAEAIARQLITRRSYALDFGLLGDALMEQGRLKEAAEAYQKMADLKPFYQSYTRTAHVRWLHGDLDGAIEAIRLAIGSASPRDPESSAWAWTRLASYQLQAGRLEEAAAAVETAFTHQADYAAALQTQGRILIARGDTPRAVEVLRRAATLNPTPEYQWLLADAMRSRGDDTGARAIDDELAARGAAADPRTVSLFLSTRGLDPGKALTLAEEELRVRQDIFTLDAHAWALHANGRAAEARDVMTRALAAGTADARLYLHAGIIDAAAGHAVESARRLRQAGALRASLLPSESALLDSSLNVTTRKGER